MNGWEESQPWFPLYELMSEISERCWSAGWLIGTEVSLWNLAVQGGGFGPVAWEISAGEAEELLWLAEDLGGWVAWDRVAGPVFVPLEQWIRWVNRNDGRT